MHIESLKNHFSGLNDTQKARAVADQFESIFVNMLLKSMRKTVPENSLWGGSQAHKIYTEMLDNSYAELLSKRADLGISEAILAQINRQNKATPPAEAIAPTPPVATEKKLSLSSLLQRYADIISDAAERFNVKKNLIKAVITQESAANPFAVSSAGAKGLMQLMDPTARSVGVSNSFDPVQNIHGGTAYLAKMLKRFDGNVKLALAAYNAGPSAVEKYGDIPPYRETQNYVQKVLAYAQTYQKDE